MRKALIAAAVATALFAVGAFAASITVSSEDIASGSDGVVACAASVQVNFDDTPTFNATTHKWTVDNANLVFATNGCDGFGVTVKVSTPTNGEAATWTGTVSGTGAAVSGGAVEVNLINGAAVLVDGKHLTVSAIPDTAP
jgi:hypothetical protein